MPPSTIPTSYIFSSFSVVPCISQHRENSLNIKLLEKKTSNPKVVYNPTFFFLFRKRVIVNAVIIHINGEIRKVNSFEKIKNIINKQ